MAEILDITPAKFFVIGDENFYGNLATEILDENNQKGIAILLEANFPQVKGLFYKDIISKEFDDVVINEIALTWHKDNGIQHMQLRFSFTEKPCWIDRVEYLDLSKIFFNVTIPHVIGIGICCKDTMTTYLIIKQNSYYVDLCNEISKIINSLNDFLPTEKQFRMEGYKDFITA